MFKQLTKILFLREIFVPFVDKFLLQIMSNKLADSEKPVNFEICNMILDFLTISNQIETILNGDSCSERLMTVHI